MANAREDSMQEHERASVIWIMAWTIHPELPLGGLSDWGRSVPES